MMADDYVRTILDVAARDASIARVLREISALAGGVRASALDLALHHPDLGPAFRAYLDGLLRPSALARVARRANR